MYRLRVKLKSFKIYILTVAEHLETAIIIHSGEYNVKLLRYLIYTCCMFKLFDLYASRLGGVIGKYLFVR